MKSLHHIAAAFLTLTAACNQTQKITPIALHPDNPHYFRYHGKPAVLITSAEHYGAVVNLDFDYVTYLRTLAEDSLNLTRVFTGAYIEPAGAFKIEKNTLAPAEGRFICPWQRSETPGYVNGGNKFDLTRWDEQYFSRLKDFVDEANERNIIVELTLFCPFYEDLQWKLSPMNAANNINSTGPDDRKNVYTLDKSNGLLSFQEELVKRIVKELRDAPNLIYEICNEPYFGGVTLDWQHHIAQVISDAESGFEQRHLISQNIANGSSVISSPHPSVSVFNFHYASPPVAVAKNYNLNKVIGDNETGFDGNADSTYRREGWAFVFSGGALYNNLDYSFTSEHETGTFQYPATQPGGGSKSLRKQLSFLKRFIGTFDYLRMKPDSTIVQNRAGFGTVQTLAEEGKQYGIYVWGKGPHAVSLAIPAGTYNVEYVDPTTGESEKSAPVRSEGTLMLTTPAYSQDVGIRVTAAEL